MCIYYIYIYKRQHNTTANPQITEKKFKAKELI